MKRTEGLEMDGFKLSVGIGQLHGGSGKGQMQRDRHSGWQWH